MTENNEKKKAEDKNEDWAIIPFDETEDDARWAKLTEETDELIKDAERISNQYGVNLRRSRLENLKQTEAEAEEALF